MAGVWFCSVMVVSLPVPGARHIRLWLAVGSDWLDDLLAPP